MTRGTYLPALVAVCLLAGCSKSSPETGAAPAQDSTMASDKMGNDSSGMAMDSTMADSGSMMMDSTKTMSDSSSMEMDTTMQMPADSTKQ
jgi:hypothetical protein